jgi:hypothetical protein
MSARQVNFPVHDLAAATRFYSAMFASAPAVLKPDCAKWTLNVPRVSLTIFTSDASRCTPSEPGWRLPRARGSRESPGIGFFHILSRPTAFLD